MFPHAIGRDRTPLIAVLRLLATVGGRGFVGVIASAIVIQPALAQNDAGVAEPDATTAARLHAQELLNQGNELFRAGQTAAALSAYREAHQVFPSPKLFFNMGLCEEALAQRARAMQHFSAFLRQAPDASVAVRTQAQASVANLGKQLAAVDLAQVVANSMVRVDGETAGLTPFEQPIWVEPGMHSLSIDRPGRPLWVTSIDVQAGVTIAMTVPDAAPAAIGSPPLAPPAADQGSPARPIWRRWWFWTGLGVIVAAGTAVTIIKLRDSCSQTVCE